ncbi:DNA-binding transcriptional regulator, GntR family [Lutimaribacter pacificus]|uniref:Transcriptional regulator, GntR family n=1 Tax=Lutimaribacter pacificus TaxID=391948 RepID=A0A1H0L9K2_9RHOB|nr:GntR family transcriptional regulator [Lutimaribacter pacificus]SDO64914.1 DNA-binding transcriptional regulator, GntR family [Lutimaribacter pacificus]SHK69689.1 transcriptional regulator, GntR family [Lutimaribacter pacificus]
MNKVNSKVNRSTEIRQIIESQIISGQRKPGERLEELQLARDFNVSRTPVREALSQLENSGLIESRGRQGTVVRTISAQQVLGVMEVLGALEMLAAGLAARRMSQDERDALVKKHEESASLVENRDFEAFEAINRELHELIYAGSRNSHLREKIVGERRIMEIVRPSIFRSVGRLEKSFQEHAAIVEEIANANDAQAERLMREHVATGGNVFADLVANLRAKTEKG